MIWFMKRKTLCTLTMDLTLFFFICATIFLPGQMVEASFGKCQTVSVDPLTASYPPVDKGHLFPPPPVKKKQHPVNTFNKKLLQLAHAIKKARQSSAVAPNANFRIIYLHTAIMQFRNAYKALLLYWQQIRPYDADQTVSHIPQSGLAVERLQRQNFETLDKAAAAWQDAYKYQTTFPRYYSAQGDPYLARLATLVDAETHGLSVDGIDLNHLARREAPALNRMPLQGDKAFVPLQQELAKNPLIKEKIPADIQSLANSLHNDPQQIYQWIHKNIRFIPTYGFTKSAGACLASGQGNAFDISNLLVTAFRSAGLKARFVFGTRDIPEWQFRRLAGNFQKLEPALRLLRHGGIPVQYIKKRETVRLEHLWVEAKLADEKKWHPYDASLKVLPQSSKNSGLLLKSRSLAGGLLTSLLQQMEGDTVFPEPQSADKNMEVSYGAAGIRFSSPHQLPSLQHKVGFQLLSALQQGNLPTTSMIPTMSLSERLITVNYQALVEMGGHTTAKTGLMQPMVHLDSTIWTKGEPVPEGVIQKLRVWFFTPGKAIDYADHRIVAGQRSVLLLQSQQRDAVDGFHYPPGDGPEFLDRTLERIGLTYLHHSGLAKDRLAHRNSVGAIKTAEELLISAAPAPFLQGEKKGIWQNYTFTVDVQRSLHAAASRNNFADNERRYHWQYSRQASIAEQKALETILGRAAISGAYYIMARVLSDASREIAGQKEERLTGQLLDQIDSSNRQEAYGQKILFQDGFASLFYDDKGIANYYIDGDLGGALGIFLCLTIILTCLLTFSWIKLFSWVILISFVIFHLVLPIYLICSNSLKEPKKLGFEFVFTPPDSNFTSARRFSTPAIKINSIKSIEQISKIIKDSMKDYKKAWGKEKKIDFIYLTSHAGLYEVDGEKFACLYYGKELMLRKKVRKSTANREKGHKIITPKELGKIFGKLSGSDYFSKDFKIILYSCQAGRDATLVKRIASEVASALHSSEVKVIAHKWATKPMYNSPECNSTSFVPHNPGDYITCSSSYENCKETLRNYRHDWEFKKEKVGKW